MASTVWKAELRGPQIWDQSIWMTHEWPAIRDGGQVSLILEVRPEDVGQVLDEGPGAIRYISHYLYRGGQAPGSTPPRDTGPTEIAACIDVDEAAGHQWDNFPDVSGDVSPFKEGVCSMHVKEWDNSESGGGGPFDDPNRAYSVEVTLFDDGATHKIGFAERTNAPLSMQSKLDTLFDVTVVKSNGYLQFQLGTVVFESDDTSCSVGKWDHGENRQMDCTFPCSWGGGDSTDGLDVDEWYP
ncbi:hypothetical protein DFH09DRAFT_1157802 [Mycena vulgaris]|nr:hypothetical protein DFH09DRAFT_1157802 [Mycena vulgaris]